MKSLSASGAVFWGFGIISLGIIILTVFLITGNFVIVDGVFVPEKLASFGAFIGGTVGVLFSLAGYFMIYGSFIQQRKQQFESTFFTMMKFHNEKINTLIYNAIDIEYKGSGVLVRAFDDLDAGLWRRRGEKKSCKSKMTEKFSISIEDEEASIDESAQVFSFIYVRVLGGYFQSLYNIYQYIHKAQYLNLEEKKLYYSILWNQLSFNEKYILYYISLSYRENIIGSNNQSRFINFIGELDLSSEFDYSFVTDESKTILKNRLAKNK